MILTKNIMTKGHLLEILRAVVRNLAEAGEVLITGRIIKDDNSRTVKDGPKI